MRPWMLGLVGQATRHHHTGADAHRLALMEITTRERYRELLGQIYAFEAPVESALIATADLDRQLLRTHLKCHRLASDLERLGGSPHELVPGERLHFDDRAQALGWLYVLDRNTLLHGLVHRYLASEVPDAVHGAGRYLSAFEGRAGALLRELGGVLDATARRPGVADRIVNAANEAFRQQRQWYSGGGQPSSLGPRASPPADTGRWSTTRRPASRPA